MFQALKTQQASKREEREEGMKAGAIIYDDGVVVMQKEWLQTINFHMQYILFTSHNVSLQFSGVFIIKFQPLPLMLMLLLLRFFRSVG